MKVISLPIWTVILLVALLYIFVTELYLDKHPRFPILFFATVWALFTSLFAVLDLSTSDLVIQLNFIGIVTLVSAQGLLLIKGKDFSFKSPILLYTLANVLALLALLLQLVSPSLLPYALLFLEILILVGIVSQLVDMSVIDIGIISVLALIGISLGSFVLRFDLPPTIVRTLIAQIFGLSSGGLFFIQGETFLMIHLAELFAVAGILILRKKWLWFMLLLTGLSYSYGPFITLRVILYIKILKRQPLLKN